MDRRDFLQAAGLAATVVATGFDPASAAQAPQPSSTARTMGARFRELLRRGQPFENVGVYDAMSAQLVEAVGFPSLILGSSATAEHYGTPGWRLVSSTEYLDFTGNVARSVNIPTLADFEYTDDALSFFRLVKEAERAGLGGVHFGDGIEVMGQRKGMLTTPQMVDKIRAGVDARADLVLVVRCNGLTAEGIDKTLERAAAYVEAGAEAMYFSPAMAWDTLPRAAAAIKVPLAANMASDIPMSKVREAGVTVATYLSLLQNLAQTAVYEGLMELKTTGLTAKSARGQRLGPALPADVRARIRQLQDYTARGKKYNVG